MIETAFTVPSDDRRLHATAIENVAGRGDPYVLFLHGGGISTTSEGVRYLRLALANAGVVSVAFDFFGLGKSGGILEDSSLQRRREETLSVVESLRPRRPRAIVATSMAGHTACRLLEDLNTEALVLFCPAAYDASAETARFGSEFRRVIRSTQDFSRSPAFAALSRYWGRLLVFYGTDDVVIPHEVQERYISSAVNAQNVESVLLTDVGHKLHVWLATHTSDRLAVCSRVIDALVCRVSNHRLRNGSV
ncbi:alpha/beta fold hydrolase [Thiomonas sp. 13-64-67]|jgi:pimeloyl-ACP methyl ester carboxylesterase